MNITLEKKNDYYTLLVNEEVVGGAWVGHTEIVKPKEYTRTHRDKVVMSFFINPNFRNKGYGKILMNKIIESEWKENTKTLRLGVEKDNLFAIKIYESSSFLIDGEVSSNMHYMWKKI